MMTCRPIFYPSQIPSGADEGSSASAGGGDMARLIGRIGEEIGLRAIRVRKENRLLMSHLFGRASHPEGGLPGGVSRK